MIRKALAIVAIAVCSIEAHKPITSPYTYNEDVFPILQARCGRCHVQGGVAPMSLMTYKDAFPWGESIRTELVAGHMPPWTVDAPAGRFKNAQALSAKELNVLLTWVTGGNPPGIAEHAPPAVERKNGWKLGPPDLVLMADEFAIGADAVEQTREFVLPLKSGEARMVRAIDINPGNAAIVRSATVSLKTSSPASPRSERAAATSESILALWVPGDDPVALDPGIGFRLPPSAEIVLRVHYKKTWEHERDAMTDRTSVGIYYAAPSAGGVDAFVLTPDSGTATTPAIFFERTVDEDLRALAIYPDPALANVEVTVTAIRPDGTRDEVIRFRPQPDWARRYWFTTSVSLPRGTRLAVSFDAKPPIVPPGAPAIAIKEPDLSAMRLTLNVVANRGSGD